MLARSCQCRMQGAQPAWHLVHAPNLTGQRWGSTRLAVTWAPPLLQATNTACGVDNGQCVFCEDGKTCCAGTCTVSSATAAVGHGGPWGWATRGVHCSPMPQAATTDCPAASMAIRLPAHLPRRHIGSKARRSTSDSDSDAALPHLLLEYHTAPPCGMPVLLAALPLQSTSNLCGDPNKCQVCAENQCCNGNKGVVGVVAAAGGSAAPARC